MRRILALALVASLLIAVMPVAVSAATPDPAPTTQQGCRHVVTAGETLSGIASQYGTSARKLAWANGIPDVNFIVAGDSLSVPCKYLPVVRKTSAGSSAPTSTPATSTSESCGTYKVKAGDSLSALSVSLDFSVEALASANGISTQAPLYIGEVLDLPCD